MTMGDSSAEIAAGRRFAFGENWHKYSALIDDSRLSAAQDSLIGMLQTTDLAGKRFVDVGSGSGLFSLAARRLGASVCSFDFDADSVACTQALKDLYYPGDDGWSVLTGSVLDRRFLGTLGEFDVVYSWGVLHHTGSMRTAILNTMELARDRGTAYIAIYNDQGPMSAVWKRVKARYVRGSKLTKSSIEIAAYLYLSVPSRVYRTLSRKGLSSRRGMDARRDLVDWVGGYPFEVAKPEEIVEVFLERGWQLKKIRTVGGRIGCNEYVFEKTLAST